MRTCIALAQHNISPLTLEEEATFAARKFARNKPPTIDVSDPSNTFNVLFSIHPTDSSRRVMEARIANDHILDIVLEQLAWLNATEQSEFFNTISGQPWLRSPLGNLYKGLTRVRFTADPTAKSLTCISATKDLIAIPVVPNVVSLSGGSNLNDANHNNLPFYWRPASSIFTSLDAIICTETMIFLLQSTVSPNCDLKKQDLDFIRANIPTCFWRNRRCCVVFVTPDEDCGTQLISKKYSTLEDFPELELCYCILPIGTSEFTSSQLRKLRKLDVGILLYFKLPLLI